jgi:subtilase family serine protease
MKQIKWAMVLIVISLLVSCSSPDKRTGHSGFYINYAPIGITFSPGSVLAGEDLEISEYIISNKGNLDNDTATITISFYLSDDGAITPTDNLLGSTQLTGLKAFESDTSGPLTLTVPTTTTNGTYYVGIYVDPGNQVTESNETDNGLPATTTLTVEGGTGTQVNYRPTSITFSPASVAAGGSGSITYTVENAGTENDNSSSISLGFYLSTDNTIALNDILIGTAAITGLNAGASTPGSGSFTVPGNTQAGTYYVGIYIDNNDIVAESNDNDNALVAAGTITITGGSTSQINYQANSVTFSPASVAAGGIITFPSYEIQNTGPGNDATLAMGIGFYLSLDNTITPSDISLGTVSIGGLNAGAKYTNTKTFPVPTGTNPNTYYVGIYADNTNLVTETNENDNSRTAAGTITITGISTSNINYIVTSVAFTPTSLYAGQNITYTSYAVQNAGSAADNSQTVNIGFYLSSDNVITASGNDIRLGALSIPGLGAGETYTSPGPRILQVPPNIPVGTYYVGIYMDQGNKVLESDESDNGGVATGTLEVMQ